MKTFLFALTWKTQYRTIVAGCVDSLYSLAHASTEFSKAYIHSCKVFLVDKETILHTYGPSKRQNLTPTVSSLKSYCSSNAI